MVRIFTSINDELRGRTGEGVFERETCTQTDTDTKLQKMNSIETGMNKLSDMIMTAEVGQFRLSTLSFLRRTVSSRGRPLNVVPP